MQRGYGCVGYMTAALALVLAEAAVRAAAGVVRFVLQFAVATRTLYYCHAWMVEVKAECLAAGGDFVPCSEIFAGLLSRV